MSYHILKRHIIDDRSHVSCYISDLNVLRVQQRLKSINDAIQNAHQLQSLSTFLIALKIQRLLILDSGRVQNACITDLNASRNFCDMSGQLAL